MKLYSVHLEVRISEIGPLEKPEPEPAADDGSSLESLVADRQKDSPLKDAARLLDGYLNKLAPTAIAFPMSRDAGMTMTENAQVVAADFEDVQAILRTFHTTLKRMTLEGSAENATAPAHR